MEEWLADVVFKREYGADIQGTVIIDESWDGNPGTGIRIEDYAVLYEEVIDEGSFCGVAEESFQHACWPIYGISACHWW